MTFSVGVLYSCQEFLRLVMRTELRAPDFPDIFTSFEVASPSSVLETSQRGNWITLREDGVVAVSERGRAIATISDAPSALRLQLRHLIESERPPWAPLIPKGRKEAILYLPGDVRQCLDEAELLSSESDEVVSWWDELAKAARGRQEDANLVTGRRGERLSIEHERKRTGAAPKWIALETNLAGYDLLSQVDADNAAALRIEVKASDSRVEHAHLYLTRDEWTVASTAKAYVFHLWSLRPQPTLHVVKVAEMQKHVPTERGRGEWSRIVIPFEALLPLGGRRRREVEASSRSRRHDDPSSTEV